MKSLSEIIRHRALLKSSISNELKSRYAGHILGRSWIVISPLLLLSIYTVVYVYVFKLKPSGMKQMEYVLYIFSGLIPFLAIAESLSTTSQSITSNVNVLKNITFPIIILPIKAIITSHLGFLVSLIVIFSMDLVLSKMSIHWIALPVVIIFQLLFLNGLGNILALLNIIIKDTSNFIVFINMVVMIASPIAYTMDMVPSELQLLLSINPFAYYFNLYQSIIALNQWPQPSVWIITFTLSFFSFLTGHWLFNKSKRIILNYV